VKTYKWEDIKAADPDVGTREYRAAYTQARRELELGLRVRELRLAAGLSQSELARRVGTRQPNIARLEGGGGMPRLETLERLADALGVELHVSLRPSRRRSVARAASETRGTFRAVTAPNVSTAGAKATSPKAEKTAKAAPLGKAARAAKAGKVAKAASPKTAKTAKAAAGAKVGNVAKAASRAKVGNVTTATTGRGRAARGS
jgi:transcriptional regulator with XRE-family HTH domain